MGSKIVENILIIMVPRNHAIPILCDLKRSCFSVKTLKLERKCI